MYRKILSILFILLTITVFAGCGTSAAEAPQPSDNNSTGTLKFTANGEDFVRQGFISKDGWDITFDKVLVNITDVTAYQTNPPYEPEMEDDIKAEQVIRLPRDYVVDLAAGDDTADPISVDQLIAPAGRYNALSWQMIPATAGDLEGYSLMMVGTAKKDGEILSFTIGVEESYSNLCGEFVGDERKGILAANSTANLEMTFHFDHIFGDGNLPADDSLNELAVGFEPFASMADNGVIDTDLAALQDSLADDTYQMLLDILPTLGHTGEGHCFYGP